MKKIIARGMFSFLVITTVIISSVVCGFAANEVVSAPKNINYNITIENSFGNEISVKTDGSKITIVNNTAKTLDKIRIKLDVNEVSFVRYLDTLKEFETKEIDLQDYYTEEFLQQNDISISIERVWLVYIILAVFVLMFITLLIIYIKCK